jgi:glutamate dehydrogenase (NADP+)
MGGGKGGSDFDPKGKSDNEVENFTRSFMMELYRHIGPRTGTCRPVTSASAAARSASCSASTEDHATSSGRRVHRQGHGDYGGSLIRPEATGYGTIYFAHEMLKEKGESFQGKTCLVSGSGNVAQFAIEKLNELGGKAVTLSDSGGFILDEAGIDDEKLKWVMWLKNEKRGRISEYCEKFPGAKYFEGQRPWDVKGDCAFPCATQNEIELDDAKALVKNGVKLVAEGANMPSTHEAISHYEENGIFYGPGKAANAGGVATSALEMSQNSQRLAWTREEVDAKLQSIMTNIYKQSAAAAKRIERPDNLKDGANIAGFIKVADAMFAQGCV